MAFTMDVRKSALESELIRCKKELRMLGAQTAGVSSSFKYFLTSIVNTLRMVRDDIPQESVTVCIAASLLYDSIKDAVSVLSGCDINEHTDWNKGLHAVNNVSLFVRGLRKLDRYTHRNFSAIRIAINETLLVEFTSASSIPAASRENFIHAKLRELGDRLDRLGQPPAYYDFLGETSKEHMISLINILKQ